MSLRKISKWWEFQELTPGAMIIAHEDGIRTVMVKDTARLASKPIYLEAGGSFVWSQEDLANEKYFDLVEVLAEPNSVHDKDEKYPEVGVHVSNNYDHFTYTPRYTNPGDAGADLSSLWSFNLRPGERKLVDTGVSLVIPDGYVGLIHPRSGLAARHGLTIVNAPGTIDSGYRGKILVNLLNTGQDVVVVSQGDKIAQLVIQRVERATFVNVDEMPESDRGDAGHGSTGGLSWHSKQ